MNHLESKIKILDVIDQEDGSAIVQMDLDDEFISWFCEHYGLDKFDKQFFQDWFIHAITQGLEKVKENGY